MIPYISWREIVRIKSRRERPDCNIRYAHRVRKASHAGCTVSLFFNRDASRGSFGWRPGNTMDGGTETVLVVDDDPDMRLLFRRILEDYGYTVLDEPDALSALAAIETASGVKLVITDYKMPRMTGLEFADILRKQRPGIPVILLTACASIENYLLSRDLGVFEFVDKSVKSGELVRIVRSALAATTHGIDASAGC